MDLPREEGLGSPFHKGTDVEKFQPKDFNVLSILRATTADKIASSADSSEISSSEYVTELLKLLENSGCFQLLKLLENQNSGPRIR